MAARNHLSLAQAAEEAGRLDEAVRHYRLAFKLDPSLEDDMRRDPCGGDADGDPAQYFTIQRLHSTEHSTHDCCSADTVEQAALIPLRPQQNEGHLDSTSTPKATP